MQINKQYILRGALKLFFELLIVFFGVLLAFLASDWSAKRNQNQRFEKTINVLQKELSNFIEYSPTPLETMKKSIQDYFDNRKIGNFPPPPFFREPRASGAPTAAWETLLASGAYEMIEPQLFLDMTLYYNRVISMNAKFNRYMLLCEEWILPKLTDNPLIFYENEKLKGQYTFQIQLLQEIISEIEALNLEAQGIKKKMEEKFPTLK